MKIIFFEIYTFSNSIQFNFRSNILQCF